MNQHERAVREALEAFCRQYTGRETDWHVETWLHPITRSVQSVTVVPEFTTISLSQRVNLLVDYLQSHLPPEHFRRVGLAEPMTPEEFEHSEWVPYEAEMVLGVG